MARYKISVKARKQTKDKRTTSRAKGSAIVPPQTVPRSTRTAILTRAGTAQINAQALHAPSTSISRSVTTTRNGNDLDWTVHDPLPASENWSHGVPLTKATFPKEETLDPATRTSIATNNQVIEIGSWISVKYIDNETNNNTKKQKTSHEFANVRAIRRVGIRGRWPVYTLLCISWGYPIRELPIAEQGSTVLTTQQAPVPLSAEDLTLSNHFDVIYLNSVADVVDDSPPNFVDIQDTRDVARFKRENDHDVQLCSSVWMDVKADRLQRQVFRGNVKREDGLPGEIGRIYRKNAKGNPGIGSRSDVAA
ncbi:hypothetical protein CAC42_453 [Sphaceloma murrayae]|uniref:Uncharacterized protein n=1 Tax=Sphaceloma murrayae TaxID=2082308 RepID=A0A2K1R3J0_9PEZI|nr:hypothetical protein CAC42_453 [Sphaceloma murrayae]